VHGSAASEIGCMIAEKGFDYLDAPIKRVTAMDSPVPFSPPLEKISRHYGRREDQQFTISIHAIQ
jgi:pyruvate/2-oxoglutarate/acetoin dehydrogenase E1 component